MFKMLKRAGRINMDDMQDRELVVKCPTCPRPGINLPDRWQEDPLRYELNLQIYPPDFGNSYIIH